MRATVMFGAGDVQIENVPDARIIEPTDALLRVTPACICGSDLWPYNQLEHSETGQRMGHEFIGVVDAVGSEVRTVKVGDVVVAPFAWSDGTCVFCQEGDGDGPRRGGQRRAGRATLPRRRSAHSRPPPATRRGMDRDCRAPACRRAGRAAAGR